MTEKAQSMLESDCSSNVENYYITDTGTYLSQIENWSVDYFPTYFYHSTLSTIFASPIHAIKAGLFMQLSLLIIHDEWRCKDSMQKLSEAFDCSNCLGRLLKVIKGVLENTDNSASNIFKVALNLLKIFKLYLLLLLLCLTFFYK